MLNKTKSLLKNKYFIALILGAISASAFAPLYFAPLAIVAFSGLFMLSNYCKNNKQSFWMGWCFGFGQFVFGLYWISISLFVDISRFFWLLPFALFLIPAVLAIYIGLVFLAVNFIAKKFAITSWRKILLLAVIWVLFEYLRSILFTGFPWNLLGYSFLFSTSLSQAAAIVGVYGLSLIAVIFYCSGALFFQIRNQKIKFIVDQNSQPFLASVAVIIGLMWLVGFYRLNNFQAKLYPNATFRLVQPAVRQEDKWNPDYRYNAFLENIRMSHKAGFENVNYVIWSESAVPYVINPLTSYGLLGDIASAAPKDGFVITGALRAEFKDNNRDINKIWNTIFMVSDQAQVSDNYDKNHLVPFGEYVPFADQFSFISKITDGAVNFSSGEGFKTIKLNSKTPSFSPLVCYEAIFPDNIIDKTNPPKFLLNLTNDAWFGSSSGPYQHFDMVKMRAIEYGMPVIRVANSGISGLIDPVGQVVAAIPLNQKGIIDVMLMENLPKTIYLKFGDKIVFWLALTLVAIALTRKLPR
ncbi:MAG: apolipoprotein N-acyltransferase [Pseudomonadota bacterium]